MKNIKNCNEKLFFDYFRIRTDVHNTRSQVEERRNYLFFNFIEEEYENFALENDIFITENILKIKKDEDSEMKNTKGPRH